MIFLLFAGSRRLADSCSPSALFLGFGRRGHVLHHAFHHPVAVLDHSPHLHRIDAVHHSHHPAAISHHAGLAPIIPVSGLLVCPPGSCAAVIEAALPRLKPKTRAVAVINLGFSMSILLRFGWFSFT
jgi:hypothetical protein